MTTDIRNLRSQAIATARAGSVGRRRRVNLVTKGVDFGSVEAKRISSGGSPCPTTPSHRFTLDTSSVRGIANDLVVRPFQWKGSVAIRPRLRSICRRSRGR